MYIRKESGGNILSLELLPRPGKDEWVLLYFVSDASLCHIPAHVPNFLLSEYAQLLLDTGINQLEMPYLIWEQLRAVVPAQKVMLLIQYPKEREQALKEGATAFLVEDAIFAERFPDQYPDVTVICPVDGRGIMGDTRHVAKRSAHIRAAGFADGMIGDYATKFVKLRCAAFSLDVEDSCGLATSSSLEWLMAGGKAVSATFGGVGGCTPLEQLLAALRVICQQPYSLKQMPRLRVLFNQIFDLVVSAHAPVVGTEIFTYESGIHADGIRKSPKTYEPFPPEDVGMERRLSIGKHSGKSALRVKLHELGVQLSDGELEQMNVRVRAESTRLRRGFTDEELLVLKKSLHGKR